MTRLDALRPGDGTHIPYVPDRTRGLPGRLSTSNRRPGLPKPTVPLLQTLPLPPAPVHESGVPPDVDEPFHHGIRQTGQELVDILGEEPHDEPGPLAIGASQELPHVGRLGRSAPLDSL